jgi:hypothetical protein
MHPDRILTRESLHHRSGLMADLLAGGAHTSCTRAKWMAIMCIVGNLASFKAWTGYSSRAESDTLAL